MTVLGISTNTRLVSVAILSNNSLIEHFTHLHKSSWSPGKRDEIIQSFEPCVRQYCIKSVALSIPHVHHQTPAHCLLVEALQTFFALHDIPVYTKTPQAFEALCPEGSPKGKKEFMKAMVQRFPALTRCYQKELRNKTKYYFKVFEAVAAAVLVTQEVQS